MKIKKISFPIKDKKIYHSNSLMMNQCRLVKQIPITLKTPYPCPSPSVGEGFGMGVCKYKVSQKLLTKRY